MIAAILHMGEIEFLQQSFDDPIEPSVEGKFKNEERVEIVAKLLGYTNPSQYKKIMLQTFSKLGREDIWKPQGYKKCTENRDALAKQAYNNMFNWLVKKMNVTIEPAELSEEDFDKRAKTIGLLDIFGFENFKHNNFEQLCINYVNEKLHKLYIAAIFEAEKMELIDEGLESIVSRIQYPSLKVLEVIKMLDYKPNSRNYAGVNFAVTPGIGIFTHLDDVCQTGRPVKWEEIADAIENTHKKNKVYTRDKKARFFFSVSHSAQEVKYDMKEFSERNMDFIPAGLENAMCTQSDA